MMINIVALGYAWLNVASLSV